MTSEFTIASHPPAPGWATHRLGDIAEIYDGPHATPAKTSSGPLFLGISSLNNGRLVLDDTVHVSEEDFAKWTRRVTPREGDLVFSYETRLGQAALIPPGLRCCLGRRMGLLRVTTPEVNKQYLLYAYLGPQFQRVLRDRTIHGSTVDRLPLREMGGFPIVLPPRVEQDEIVRVLGALDHKIESNSLLSGCLHETARGLLDKALQTDAVETTVGAQVDFHNRRRKPLSAAQRAAMPGKVPYYGATGVFDYVAEALFDEVLLLVGEDGSVVRPDGTPVTQYVWGPAWVNNHAHVLTGREISTELATLVVGHARVGNWVTGAVQPKLSMTNLKQVSIRVPGPGSRQWLEAAIAPVFGLIRGLAEETKTLRELRDTILPRLVDGSLPTASVAAIEAAVA